MGALSTTTPAEVVRQKPSRASRPGRSQQQLLHELQQLWQPETKPRPASAAHVARRKRFMC
jgi:hypothetical protein